RSVLVGARSDQFADSGGKRFRFSLAGSARGVFCTFPRSLGLVTPFLRIIPPLARVKSREQAAQVFGVLEVLPNQRGGVGVVNQIVAEEALACREILPLVGSEGKFGNEIGVVFQHLVDQG